MLCNAPFPFAGGYLDGCPLRCLLPAGHRGHHSLRLLWTEGGWSDVSLSRYCNSPYPWVAGVICLREIHSPDEPHQLGQRVADALAVPREWDGSL